MVEEESGRHISSEKPIRNDGTQTSLFEMTDYNNNVKFIKRQMGTWTDLTSSLPTFEDITVAFQMESEVFLNIRLFPGDRQFWYFQSTSIGDTLANVTPPGANYNYINYFRTSLVPFPSFEFLKLPRENIFILILVGLPRFFRRIFNWLIQVDFPQDMSVS